MMQTTIIAIDPGREKCGIAVVEKNGVLYQKVIGTLELITVVKKLSEQYQVSTIVMGNGTSSDKAKKKLEEALAESKIDLQLIDEYRTTDAAKIRYWQTNPPRGLKRLIPTSMQVPPVPVDDYVAVILAERYFLKP
ncbi:MAG: Holliday junction resolvase YqgF [Massilibacillus sp.]|jgi:RNase H-fold protein (predicted Holliday junction resolvase)|nr:Holliday junction resolvase YqgF [Massilibacillus sp.]